MRFHLQTPREIAGVDGNFWPANNLFVLFFWASKKRVYSNGDAMGGSEVMISCKRCVHIFEGIRLTYREFLICYVFHRNARQRGGQKCAHKKLWKGNAKVLTVQCSAMQFQICHGNAVAFVAVVTFCAWRWRGFVFRIYSWHNLFCMPITGCESRNACAFASNHSTNAKPQSLTDTTSILSTTLSFKGILLTRTPHYNLADCRSLFDNPTFVEHTHTSHSKQWQN